MQYEWLYGSWADFCTISDLQSFHNVNAPHHDYPGGRLGEPGRVRLP